MKVLSHFLFGTLRGRLIVGVAAVHAVMMALFVADLTARQRVMLLEHQVEAATALSQTLATSAAGWIAADDISGLQELAEAQRRYPETIFVIMTDEDGLVLADIGQSKQGQYLLDLPREVRRTVLSSTPALVDVAVPAMIGGRHAGWVRVGLGQQAASEKLASIIKSGVVYALAAIGIGSLIAWQMGCRITRRLYAVQETIDAVRTGNRRARSALTGTDEAAVMAREFNSMLDALAERDVELTASDKSLHRLNRELRAISNCNQVLVRSEDEQTLLNNICRIICAEADYCLAWVGYAEHDAAKTVRPAAWAGAEDGYLKNANITWADTERGRGPTGTAIRSGASVCVQDFAIDPQAALWRASALQRGYRSSLALPLPDEDGDIFGALNIYSTEPNTFTPEEIRLLEELAGDLAFGIMVLRSRLERQQAEAELRRMNEQFSLATKAARLGVWDWDIQKNELRWDDIMYALYGIKPDSFTGAYEAWLQGLHPDDRAACDEISRLARLGERAYDTEFRVVWPDGSTHYLKAYGQVVRDAQGNALRMTGVNFDITERRRAEKSLRESEVRLKEAQRIAHLGHWELNLQKNTLYWSDEVYRIFGLEPQEFGATYEAFLARIHADDRDLVNRAYTESLKNKTGYDLEHRIVLKNGAIKYVNERCVTEYDNQGTPLRSLGTVLDITDRKQTEENLTTINQDLDRRVQERTAELEEKNAELERMNQLFVGRELRMVELKEKIRALEAPHAARDDLS